MPWNQQAKDKQQARLPAGWQISFAPDYGYMIVREADGGRLGRKGEFHIDPRVCVDTFLNTPDAVPILRPDAWIEIAGERYLDYAKIAGLLGDDDLCPSCGAQCPEDYDDPEAYIGMTPKEHNIAAEMESAGTPAYSWTEVWRCACKAYYAVNNCNY